MNILKSIFRFIVNFIVGISPAPYQLQPLENPLTDPIPSPVVSQDTTSAPKRAIVHDFCLAITDYEGGPNDLNHRNNNPGNIRGTDGHFLQFKTFDIGFAYLEDYVTRACTGKHLAYKPNYTIAQFFQVFSPSDDHNDPLLYAKYVANRLKLPITTQIKDLVV